MKKMRKLDEKEEKIVRGLIRNPRASDNNISKRTGIPVMTVNRKRKHMEEEGLIRYYMSTSKGDSGLQLFGAKRLYIIKLKIGITREKYFEALEKDPNWRMFNSTYISLVYLGEREGHLALVIILDAKTEGQLVEEFNGKIVSFLKQKLGEDCIKEVITTNLDKLVRVHHNYLPAINMERGKIKKDWPDSYIFVDEVK
ncbi:MAG: Lrp/AsnC family transcriptional regulator [Candidatus Aenigmarchaeota archaeon]|nr:Lrp/AsnC family transcriptional regulator [Candidatus Aenigmarchaeota archaeon]